MCISELVAPIIGQLPPTFWALLVQQTQVSSASSDNDGFVTATLTMFSADSTAFRQHWQWLPISPRYPACGCCNSRPSFLFFSQIESSQEGGDVRYGNPMGGKQCKDSESGVWQSRRIRRRADKEKRKKKEKSSGLKSSKTEVRVIHLDMRPFFGNPALSNSL